MMSGRMARVMIAATFLGVLAAHPVFATEPRPWLCRQIPVFSDDKPMTWSANRTGMGEWVMTFMHYDPQGGGHDGFTVISIQKVGSGASGTLAAGRYYAVALHRSGSHWICPANASPTGASAGYITRLCYGADEDSCDVRFTVEGAGGSTP